MNHRCRCTLQSVLPTDMTCTQAFHITVRLLLFRASVTKWTLVGFAFSALIQLFCYRALAAIAGEWVAGLSLMHSQGRRGR